MAKVIHPGTPKLPSDKEMAAGSPYEEKSVNVKRTQPRQKAQQGSAALRKSLDRAQEENARLKEQIQAKKEYTPTFRVDTDGSRLVATYHGKVAGQPQTRDVEIAAGPDAGKLYKILSPIMSVMNAALTSKKLEETLIKGERSSTEKPLYTATSLTKAAYAYRALLANPTFVQQLDELNKVIDQTFQSLGVQPKDLKVSTRDDQKDGQPWYSKVADLNRPDEIPGVDTPKGPGE